MKAAVFSVTEKGRKLSERIFGILKSHDVRQFCFYRYAGEKQTAFENLKNQVEKVFYEYEILIFICACGIAVRSIAPFIKSKTSDPAVIVIDDSAKFAISLLSGHIGGANSFTEIIAREINAVPVITTATDTGGKFSPDSFAAANNLIISDISAAKEIASAVLNGGKIGFYSDYEYINKPDVLDEKADCRTGICICDDCGKKPFPVTLTLIPKNIVLGIGCKRNTSLENLEKTVDSALEKAGIQKDRICAVSSIDIKADESCLLMFAEKYHLPFYTFSADELAELKGDFSQSDFVRSITGVDNICERSAVMCGGGKLILRKFALNGVTAALAEKPVQLDFCRERKLI